MFLHLISRKFKFRTIEVFCGKRKLNAADILESIKKVINIYKAQNLNFTQIDTDMEFKSLESKLLPIKLNVSAADEHVSDVERSIRTIKEGTRTLLHEMPYKYYHKQLLAGGGDTGKRIQELDAAEDHWSTCIIPVWKYPRYMVLLVS